MNGDLNAEEIMQDVKDSHRLTAYILGLESRGIKPEADYSVDEKGRTFFRSREGKLIKREEAIRLLEEQVGYENWRLETAREIRAQGGVENYLNHVWETDLPDGLPDSWHKDEKRFQTYMDQDLKKVQEGLEEMGLGSDQEVEEVLRQYRVLRD